VRELFTLCAENPGVAFIGGIFALILISIVFDFIKYLIDRF